MSQIGQVSSMFDTCSHWEAMKKTSSIMKNTNLIQNRIRLLKREQNKKIREIHHLLTSHSLKSLNSQARKNNQKLVTLPQQFKSLKLQQQQQLQHLKQQNLKKKEQQAQNLKSIQKALRQQNSYKRNQIKKQKITHINIIKRDKERQWIKNRQRRDAIVETKHRKQKMLESFWNDRLAMIHKSKEEDIKQILMRYQGGRMQLLDFQQQQLMSIEQYQQMQRQKQNILLQLKKKQKVKQKFTRIY